MAEWFYSQKGRRLGPVSEAELKRLAGGGEVSPSDLLWTDGMDDWMPASKLDGLFPKPVHQPPVRNPPPLPTRRVPDRLEESEEEEIKEDDVEDARPRRRTTRHFRIQKRSLFIAGGVGLILSAVCVYILVHVHVQAMDDLYRRIAMDVGLTDLEREFLDPKLSALYVDQEFPGLDQVNRQSRIYQRRNMISYRYEEADKRFEDRFKTEYYRMKVVHIPVGLLVVVMCFTLSFGASIWLAKMSQTHE